MLGLATSVLHMYDIEKCSASLENASGFVRRDACIYMWPCNKMAALGMFIQWGYKLRISPSAVRVGMSSALSS